MVEQLNTVCQYFLTEDCCDEFLVKHNFFHVECLKAALSKGLGLGLVAGSMMVKVPQITKILAAKSAEGISFTGTLLELFAIMSSVAYGFLKSFPFSAYGDSFFLLLQTAFIGALVLFFGGSSAKATVFLVVVTSYVLTLCSGSVPMAFVWTLQAANIPIVFAGKMIQAVSNYKNGSTGQLSAVTVSMLFFGSFARILTSVQETGDTTVILTYIIATLANGIIAAQLMYYWNTPKKTKKE